MEKIKCPYCGSYKITYNIKEDEYECKECSQTWKEKIYKIKKIK